MSSSLLVFERALCANEQDPPEQAILVYVQQPSERSLERPASLGGGADGQEQHKSVSVQCFLMGVMSALVAFRQQQQPQPSRSTASSPQGMGRPELSAKKDGISVISLRKSKWAYAEWQIGTPPRPQRTLSFLWMVPRSSLETAITDARLCQEFAYLLHGFEFLFQLGSVQDASTITAQLFHTKMPILCALLPRLDQCSKEVVPFLERRGVASHVPFARAALLAGQMKQHWFTDVLGIVLVYEKRILYTDMEALHTNLLLDLLADPALSSAEHFYLPTPSSDTSSSIPASCQILRHQHLTLVMVILQAAEEQVKVTLADPLVSINISSALEQIHRHLYSIHTSQPIPMSIPASDTMLHTYHTLTGTLQGDHTRAPPFLTTPSLSQYLERTETTSIFTRNHRDLQCTVQFNHTSPSSPSPPSPVTKQTTQKSIPGT